MREKDFIEKMKIAMEHYFNDSPPIKEGELYRLGFDFIYHPNNLTIFGVSMMEMEIE